MFYKKACFVLRKNESCINMLHHIVFAANNVFINRYCELINENRFVNYAFTNDWPFDTLN